MVSELSWFNKADATSEVKAYLQDMYARLENSSANTIEENLETAKSLGYTVIESFKLPLSSWWENYYTPIQAKLPQLRAKHQDDPDALAYLDGEDKEIDMFRRYIDYCGYAFYVLKKT